MGGSTIRTSDTHLDALTLQSSCYGGVIPLCFGVCQVAVNLLWYNGFKSVPTTTSSGGKGGGVKQQNTTYTYAADVVMGISGTVITSVPRIWVGKNLYSGGINGSQLPTVTEPYTVQTTGAMTYPLVHAATFAGMQSVTRTIQAQDGTTGVTVPCSLGADYTVENGILTIVNNALRTQTLAVTYQYTTGSPSTGALSTLGFSLLKGNIGQAAWAGLASYGTQNIAYSGISYVAATQYNLGTDAQVDNHVLEVVGPYAYALGSSQPDADPAAVMSVLMTSARSGANFPPQSVDFSQWSNYCVANNLLISPCIAEQQTAADILDTAADLTNSAVVWSGGRLKVLPYGDQAATANGRTYTPNTTPVYDLDDTCWVDPGGMSDPVTYELKTSADRFNHVRIEYLDRSQQYNVAIADARDMTDIRATGLRDMDTVTAHWVCVMSIAQNMAQLMLQRQLYVNGTYKFTLPWHFILLEPMDLVTITDSILALAKWPVRITSITEGEDGMIEVEAEDYPAGMASATLYPNQNPGGYQHDYNTPAGLAPAPIVFEGVAGKSITGLAVSVAVKPSTNPNWGGAQVWVSSDGTNYKQVGVVYGPSRAGTLSAAVAPGDTAIAINNLSAGSQLLSGSSADAANLNTLCYIGGANPEYLAYQTATLTGAQAYTLSGLNRGAYQTGSLAHSAGDPFVRVDTAVATIEDLDLSMVGKVIYIKLCSFNQYGGAQQGLADVTATPYTITGYMAMLPPTAPVSLTPNLEGFGVRLITVKSPDLDITRYEYRVGASWAAGLLITSDGGTSYFWSPQNVGSYVFWVAAVDAYGAYSAPISGSITVGAGTVSGLAQTLNGDSIVLNWSGVLGSFANYGYEVRYGATFAGGTSDGIYTVTTYTEKVRWTGTRTYWVAPIDVKGNYGTAQPVTVVMNAPGPVNSMRADVVDNNVLLYWTAPSTGTLPIAAYEVRKGATWATAALIGSNSNSTFCGVFEQLAGTYTYWFAAIDTAGTYGTPASLSAAVTQPPDYILRANFNSTFNGTLSNMYLEQGVMLGPIDTTKTWATHFTGNSWTSPQDQIAAGYPIYIEPSVSSGTYTETFDYGTILPAVLITITPTTTVVAGAENLTCLIYTSPDNVTYTAQPAGFSALGTAFRYVRFVLTMTGMPGANLMAITNVNVKLNIKQRMDSGQNTSVLGGVTCTFGYPFIEADVPMVQAAGLDSFGKPYFCAVIYTGPPNPTTFSVRIFDSSGVERAGVNFSWTVRGY